MHSHRGEAFASEDMDVQFVIVHVDGDCQIRRTECSFEEIPMRCAHLLTEV
jgi:hypothetical protein